MIIQHNVLKKGRDKESVCLIKRIGDQYSEFGTYLLNDNRERKLMQNYGNIEGINCEIQNG